jgi:hypothetical protein
MADFMKRLLGPADFFTNGFVRQKGPTKQLRLELLYVVVGAGTLFRQTEYLFISRSYHLDL